MVKNNELKIGDLCLSTAGRDKGKTFLIIDVNETRAKIVDGKIRKVTSPKEKNVKHLKKLDVDGLEIIATQIKNGEKVGSKRVKSLIAKKIKRED